MVDVVACAARARRPGADARRARPWGSAAHTRRSAKSRARPAPTFRRIRRVSFRRLGAERRHLQFTFAVSVKTQTPLLIAAECQIVQPFDRRGADVVHLLDPVQAARATLKHRVFFLDGFDRFGLAGFLGRAFDGEQEWLGVRIVVQPDLEQQLIRDVERLQPRCQVLDCPLDGHAIGFVDKLQVEFPGSIGERGACASRP